MRCWRMGGIMLLAVAITAGCSGGGEKPASGGKAASSPGTPATGGQQAGGGASTAVLENSFEKVIQQVLPSIVQINTESGLGSGVIFDTAGHIVTNAHVIGRATDFQVTLATGGKPQPAELVSSFPEGDLAVIKMASARGLRPARFADSGKARVGQLVLAMGNPLGLSASVTNGIVSALGRTVTEPPGRGSPGATISDMIQTSAAINPGNSGGALVNMESEVVGIPTLAATDPEMGDSAAPGIGFAISSSTASDITTQIIKNGKVVNSRKAALGVSVRTVIDAETHKPEGVGVVEVQPDGGAAKAGIQPGDVIVSVNGTPTPTQNALSEVLAELKPGDRVKVGLVRAAGGDEEVTATLGELSTGR